VSKRVVIIGGGAAGMSTASRVKRLKPDWDVKVFEATKWVSHAPCGIPYVVEGISPKEKLMHYPPEFFIKKRGIDLHLNARVVEVEQGRVRVEEKDGKKAMNGITWFSLMELHQSFHLLMELT